MPDHVSGTRDPTEAATSSLLLTVLTIGVGVLVANLYYAQPLVAGITRDLGITSDLAGSIVSVTQKAIYDYTWYRIVLGLHMRL